MWLLEPRLVLSGPAAGKAQAQVYRIDELSGRRLRKLILDGDVQAGTIATGNGAVWVLESNGKLLRIDPLTNRVMRSYDTNAIETKTLIPFAGYEWICECIVNTVLRFDGRTGRSRTFKIPERAYLAGVESLNGETLWLLEPQGATLTPMNPSSGKTEPPLGLSGQPRQAVVAFGAVWAAAGRVVDRLDLRTRARTEIQMPAWRLGGQYRRGPGNPFPVGREQRLRAAAGVTRPRARRIAASHLNGSGSEGLEPATSGVTRSLATPYRFC